MKKSLTIKYFLISLSFIIKQNFLNAQCWSKVSASSTHTLALQLDGSLWAWGSSGDLGIGIPSTPNYNSPIQIGTQNDWAEISAGANFSLAIKNDGSLWAWGSFANAVLGGNNTTNLTAYSPVQIGNDYDWVQVSAGGQHALGLKSNHTLWSWGLSNMGQVGNGVSSCTFCPPVYQAIPVQIGTENDWKQISACQDFSVAIKFNGTLWCWGGNWPTFVNNGFALNNIPTQIGTDTTWSQVDGGEYAHLLSMKTDGTIWTWGYDITTDTPFVVISVPFKIGTDNDWVNISAGTNHDMAIKTDGTIWTWGRNSVGQLGNGSAGIVQGSPQPILTSVNNNFNEICGANEYSMGIKSDGSLWAWGNNGSGQLGIGNNQNQITPQLVTCNTVNSHEVQTENKLSVFPNPTSGSICLTANERLIDSYFQICNILGIVVLEGYIRNEKTIIETRNFSKGLYFLKAGKNLNLTFKIIKE